MYYKKMKIAILAAFCCAAFTLPAKEAIVFVGGHPDDSEGFAATAFLLKDKYDIHIVDLTRGERGLGLEGMYDGSTAAKRVAEEYAACRLLGAKAHFLHEVNGWACASERSIHSLTELFIKLRPIAVFTHWPIDNHADHAQCSAIMANALRKSGLKPERYFFEEWMRQTRNMAPTYYVDISGVFRHKLAILSFYECQNKDGYLLKMTEKRARWRGRQRVPAVEFAEPFTTWDGRPIKGGVLESLKETAVAPGATAIDVSTETDVP